MTKKFTAATLRKAAEPYTEFLVERGVREDLAQLYGQFLVHGGRARSRLANLEWLQKDGSKIPEFVLTLARELDARGGV